MHHLQKIFENKLKKNQEKIKNIFIFKNLEFELESESKGSNKFLTIADKCNLIKLYTEHNTLGHTCHIIMYSENKDNQWVILFLEKKVINDILYEEYH